MNRLQAILIKLSLIGLAGIAIFHPDVPHIRAFSDTGIHQIGFNNNSNLILLKRGPLDTEAHRNLDTSLDDQRALSVMDVSETKQTRVVQFAGPIKNFWFQALQATGAQIVGYVANNA